MKRFALAFAVVAGALAPAAAQAQQYIVTQQPIVYAPLAAGTNVFGGRTDDGSASIALPFTFSYYGQNFNTVGVSSNGLLHLGGTSSSLGNAAIPTAAQPNDIIAAWWTDGMVNAAGDCRHTTLGVAPNREFVVEWANFGRFGLGAISSMQVHLFESGQIQVHYGTHNGVAGDTATAGIEDSTGSASSVSALGNCSPNCDHLDWPTNQMLQYGASVEPDVTPQTVVLGPMTQVGSDLVFSADTTVRNLGQNDAVDVQWELYLSAGDGTLDPATDLLLATHGVGETIAGQTAATFNDPLTTPRPNPGEYWVCARLDPANLVVESLEGNNSGCTANPFLIGADLLGTVSIPVQGAPGETVPTTVHIENRGTDATGPFQYGIYFSADTTLDPGDDLLFTGTIDLQGTDRYDAVEDVFVPGNISGTQHYAILEIDRGNAVAEGSEANNVAVSPGEIELIKADLRLIEVTGTAPNGCFFGDTFTIEYEVCNEGGGNARDFVISTLLSDNATITINDPEVFAIPQSCPGQTDAECTLVQPGVATCDFGTCSAPCVSDAECGGDGLVCGASGTCQNHLGPGECRTYVHTFDVPAADFAGNPFQSADYFFGVIVDSVDSVNEENEGNNIKHTGPSFLCRAPAMDLVTTAMAPPARMAAGEASPIFRVIRNAGNLAGSYSYRYFLSSNPVISANDVPLDVQATGGPGSGTLDAYTEDQSSDLVVIPSGVPAGDYYLGLVIDPDGAVAELDETNNSYVAPATVRVEVSSLRIATTSLPDATVGLAYTRHLVATGGDGAYVFDHGDLPPGMTLDADGLFHGTPSELGTTAFHVTVRSGGATAEALLPFRVNPPTTSLAVATETLPPGTVANAYNASLAAVGGIAPYRWAIVGGVLPGGIRLENAALTGTPGIAGESTFTVRVTDAIGNEALRDLTLVILDAADLAITTQRFVEGLAGQPYVECAEAQGGDGAYTFSIDPATAPPGLAFEQQGTRGCLNGAPLACGSFVVSVSVVDGAGQTDSAELPLTVICNRLVIRTQSLPDVHRLDVVDEQLDAAQSGTYRLYAGALPEGLSLAADGVVSGTVSETATIGLHSFIVELSDGAGGVGLAALSMRVLPDPLPEPPPAETAGGDDGGCGCAAGTGSQASLLGLGLGVAALLRRRRPLRGARRLLPLAALALLALPGFASAQQGYTLRQYPIAYTPIANGTSSNMSGDDQATTINLPFSVTFYGQSYNAIGVSTNGLVTFGGTSTVYSNQSIPNANAPNNMIAVWWDDSQVLAGSDVSYTTVGSAPTREFIVQWANWPHLGGGGGREAQVHLFEGSSTVVVHYGTYSTSGDSATVGIEDAAGGALSVAGLGCNPSCGAANWPTNQAISYSQGPDVIVSAVTADAIGYTGVSMHMEATATNVGGADAIGFGMRFHVSRDGALSADDTLLGDAPNTETASPGLSASFVLDVPLPVDLAAGDYYIVAEVDPLDAVAEDAEGNNYAAYGPFPLGVPAPDLTVESIAVPNGATPGQDFTLTWVARNLGNDVAVQVPYVLVLSENEVVTASDRAIFDGVVDAQPLTTADVQETVTLPADVGSGTYYLGIVIDPQNQVYELGELNNLGVSADTFVVSRGTVDIATTELPQAQVGATYCKLLVAVGGSGTYEWSVAAGSTLPPGLGFVEEPAGARVRGDEYATLLCGSPASAGTFTFTVEVASGAATDSQELTLEVTAAELPLTIVTAELPTAAFQVPFEAGLSAVGGRVPYTWAIAGGALPPGLAMGPSGVLEGAPQSDGTFAVTVQVSDAAGATDTMDLAVRVAPPGRLTCATRALPKKNVGETYLEQLLAAGGTKPYAWSTLEYRRLAGSGDAGGTFPEEAPPGLVLASSGAVSGTPSVAGQYLWTVQVSDRTDGEPQVDTCTINVAVGYDQGIAVVTRGLPDAFPGEDYEASLEATGGEGFLTWSLAEGSALPEGLELSADGTIDGALEETLLDGQPQRTFNFLVQVRDSQSRVGLAGFSITLRTVPVAPPPVEEPAPKADEGGCQSSGGPVSVLALGVVALALFVRRRRRA